MEDDLGFSVKYNRSRFLKHDGTANLERRGVSRFKSLSIYHTLISISWTKFNLIVLCFYLLCNLLFAGIYTLIGVEQLNGISSESGMGHFGEAFFFSAQTLSTVGYGRIAPVGFMASAVASIEAMIGLLGFALATGLLYGRFSRPVIKLIYSDKAIIAPYQGIKGLMFRIANEQNTTIIESEVQVTLAFLKNENGKIIRRFSQLDLERNKIALFSGSWTVVHPISEDSPLFNITKDEFEKMDPEILVFFKAYDDTFADSVHSRFSYKWQEVEWNARFTSILGTREDGGTYVELDKISDFEKLSEN